MLSHDTSTRNGHVIRRHDPMAGICGRRHNDRVSTSQTTHRAVSEKSGESVSGGDETFLSVTTV